MTLVIDPRRLSHPAVSHSSISGQRGSTFTLVLPLLPISLLLRCEATCVLRLPCSPTVSPAQAVSGTDAVAYPTLSEPTLFVQHDLTGGPSFKTRVYIITQPSCASCVHHHHRQETARLRLWRFLIHGMAADFRPLHNPPPACLRATSYYILNGQG